MDDRVDDARERLPRAATDAVQFAHRLFVEADSVPKVGRMGGDSFLVDASYVA
jgi:hypothetical protein